MKKIIKKSFILGLSTLVLAPTAIVASSCGQQRTWTADDNVIINNKAVIEINDEDIKFIESDKEKHYAESKNFERLINVFLSGDQQASKIKEFNFIKNKEVYKFYVDYKPKFNLPVLAGNIKYKTKVLDKHGNLLPDIKWEHDGFKGEYIVYDTESLELFFQSNELSENYIDFIPDDLQKDTGHFESKSGINNVKIRKLIADMIIKIIASSETDNEKQMNLFFYQSNYKYAFVDPK